MNTTIPHVRPPYSSTPVGGVSCAGLTGQECRLTIIQTATQMERGTLSLVSARSQQLSTQWAAWIRPDVWINLIREANSSPAALWLHTAERAPVLGLATGFLCVREPLWIEFLTNLSTWSGNIQQLHCTFHLQWMQFNWETIWKQISNWAEWNQ